jgi:hypothetical protein
MNTVYTSTTSFWTPPSFFFTFHRFTLFFLQHFHNAFRFHAQMNCNCIGVEPQREQFYVTSKHDRLHLHYFVTLFMRSDFFCKGKRNSEEISQEETVIKPFHFLAFKIHPKYYAACKVSA